MSSKINTTNSPIESDSSKTGGKSKQTGTTDSPDADTKFPLDQQQINDMLVSDKAEVWRSGVYRRTKYYSDGLPPTPSPGETCPHTHFLAAGLEQVAERPVYVSAIGEREDDGQELIGLTYLTTGKIDDSLDTGEVTPSTRWRTQWATYPQIADETKVLGMADQLFPVQSSNKRALSDFLVSSYNANLGLARKIPIVRRTGLHNIAGSYGWAVGERWVGPGTVRVDPDDHKLTKALRSKGTEQAWIETTRYHWEKNWIVRFLIGAACTSPLLEFIGVRSFILHHFVASGSAKSLLAHLGQSLYGHPKEFSMSLARAASTTSLTEIFRYHSSLPLLVDETQGRDAKVSLSDFAMQACSEEHKARAKADGGMQASTAKEWRCLIRSTGEQTFAGADQVDLGGQAGRVVEIRHPGLTREQGIELWRWTMERPQHYGTVGLKYLAQLVYFVNDREKLDGLVRRYQSFVKIIEEYTKQSRPLEAQMAAICMGEYLSLIWIYGLDKETAIHYAVQDTCTMLQSWMRTREASAPLWRRGIDALIEHRYMYGAQYADVSTPEGKHKLKSDGAKGSSPFIACLNAGRNADEVWYIPTAVNKILYNTFQSPADRFWEELSTEGVLERGTDRLTKKRGIPGFLPEAPMYVLKQDKIFKAAESYSNVDVSRLLKHAIVEDFFEEPSVNFTETVDNED